MVRCGRLGAAATSDLVNAAFEVKFIFSMCASQYPPIQSNLKTRRIFRTMTPVLKQLHYTNFASPSPPLARLRKASFAAASILPDLNSRLYPARQKVKPEITN
jgi:hypothetical protein